MPLKIDEENNYFILRQNDFSGGLNTRDLDPVMVETELSDIENLVFDKRGALKIRKGFRRITTQPYGTGKIKSLGVYYKVGQSPALIATQGTSIGRFNSSTSVFDDIKDDLSGDGEYFDMHQFMNHFYMANGEDSIQVYNGTDIWDIGYPIPDDNVTTAEGSAGVLEAGTYKYKVTFGYVDGESNPCEEDEEVTITASKKINVTAIPIGGSRVVSRKLYRTIKDGEEYNLLTTINDNTTTTYEDNIPDSGLGAVMDEDNDEPPICKYVINHKGRMWFAGDPDNPSRLYFSKALHPESVGPFAYWDIGRDDGDIITGIKVNLGALIIFKQYSTWVLSGDQPTGENADMILEKVNPTIGCINNKAISHAGNDLLFLTPNMGIHRLHRILLASTETMDSEALSDKIFETISTLNRAAFDKAHSIVFKHKFFLFVPSGNNEDINSSIVLDLRKIYPSEDYTIAWTKYTNMNFDSSTIYLDNEGEHLYVGSNENGHLYELEVTTSDDGTPIEASATTKWYDIENFASYKVPRALFTYGRASEDYKFNIRLYRNEGNNIVNQDLYSFEGGQAVPGEDVLFDEALFDRQLFDNDSGFTNIVYDYKNATHLTKRGYKFKLKIEGISATSEFTWYGFEIRGFISMPKVTR